MKKTLLLLLLLCGTVTLAQEYPFLTPTTRRAQKHEFVSYRINLPKSSQDSVLKSVKRYKDDGTTYTEAYADSIFNAKTIESSAYTTITYVDTVSNQYYDVLHKRTKEELDVEIKALKEKFDRDEKNRKKLKGATVDNFTMVDMQGNSYTAEQLRGKVVIIDFWFTTCAPCIQEMPELNKIKEDFGTDEVAYFAVTYDEKAKVEKFLGRVKYDYTIIPDSRHLTEKFGITFYPTTLIVDKEGKVVYTGDLMGLKEKPKEMRKLLKKLTSGKQK
jgi:thiol-disulfide isomerase/thioredoxin